MDPERREYQRLHLTQPLDGWLGDYAVRLLDVSASGALIETDEEIPVGSRALLRFWWQQEEIEITAETVRNALGHYGVQFIEESAVLRRFIADTARAVLVAQEANAAGARQLNVFAGEQTLTAASAGLAISGYYVFTLENGTWQQRKALLPDQPENGFTVAAGERPEQIEMLCRTYESGDAEARRMIRLLAELSAKK